MNRIKLFFQYRKMLRTVRNMLMYDGRGQGTDVYVCSDCGRKFYTEYKDEGCVPFTIRCRFFDVLPPLKRVGFLDTSV